MNLLHRLLYRKNRVVGVTTDKEQYACDAAIICTGGASYPLTGSTGDGYVLAEKSGTYYY